MKKSFTARANMPFLTVVPKNTALRRLVKSLANRRLVQRLRLSRAVGLRVRAPAVGAAVRVRAVVRVLALDFSHPVEKAAEFDVYAALGDVWAVGAVHLWVILVAVDAAVKVAAVVVAVVAFVPF